MVVLPIGILLTTSKNQRNWCLAAVYPFVATVLGVGFGRFIQYLIVFLVLLLLICIQSIRQNHFLMNDCDEIPVSPRFEEKVNGETLYYYQIQQDVLLKLVFMGAKPVKWNINRDIESKKYILKKTDGSVVSSNQIGYIGNYRLF